MKTILTMTAILTISFFSRSLINAAEPIITRNVHVAKNVTPAQCKSSWEGNAGPAIESTVSQYGENDILSSPIIQSCSDCAYDSVSHDCVCKTC